MAEYHHEIVAGLARLIANYGGKVKGHPVFGALWLGLKGQIPGMLQSLDENDEACAQIRKEVLEALGMYEVGEAEITVVPAEGEGGYEQGEVEVVGLEVIEKKDEGVEEVKVEGNGHEN